MAQFFDAMEYIWERLPKNKDGKTISYLPGDPAYLYHNGFVDAIKYTFDQWLSALIPFKNKDSSGYTLDRRGFMMLKVFRYHGPSHEVFDPVKLRDGSWPNDELEYLYENSVRYSSTISRDIFWRSIDALKKKGFTDKSGQLLVNDVVKKQFEYLVEKFPSPQRRLEKEVKRLREERDEELSKHQSNRDASSFTIGTSQKEEELKKFKELETAQKPATEKSTPDDSGAVIDIRSLKKPTGKVKG